MTGSEQAQGWKRFLSFRHVAGKVREKGAAWCFRSAAGRLWGLICHPVRPAVGFLAWVFPTLGTLLSSTDPGGRRLLAIYDLSCQPFSIGDILLIQEASLALREKHHLGQVDFAMVYDPKHPASSDPGFAGITEENVLYHLASVLPVVQVNQHLGSLLVFNSHAQLQRFVADNADRYHVWPSAWQFAKREYLYYTVFNEVLYQYHREHGTVPHLSCRQFLTDWTKVFYREHVYPRVPVTVQVRNNKAFHPHRNLRQDCWVEFFRHCEERYPVTFVAICVLDEVDERLRQCPNVVIAKDYHTSIEQDLALIHTAAINMGSSSGPGSMAVFSAKPYLFIGTTLVPHLYRDTVYEENLLRLFFAGPLQHYSVEPETTELLIAEFARMWAAVDVAQWSSSADSKDQAPPQFYSWLR